MDPVFPLMILAAIGAAAALGWRSVRANRGAGWARTSWKVICYSCTYVHRRPNPDCAECASSRMMPLSKYQAKGGGTGFWLDKNGPMISSLCEGEWEPSDEVSNRPQGRRHAPLFDLDFPASLTSNRSGATLVVRRIVSGPERDALYRLMAELRLAAPPTEAKPAAGPRIPGIEGYRAPARAVVLETAFQLTVPAMLVPSSTEGHFHLYLETEMDWGDYLGLMRCMVDAGLLEKDWVDMNERRRMAMLRKPEFKKAPT